MQNYGQNCRSIFQSWEAKYDDVGKAMNLLAQWPTKMQSILKWKLKGCGSSMLSFRVHELMSSSVTIAVKSRWQLVFYEFWKEISTSAIRKFTRKSRISFGTPRSRMKKELYVRHTLIKGTQEQWNWCWTTTFSESKYCTPLSGLQK